MAASIIDRALMLNPNFAHAWMASGLVSCFRCQPGPAIEALQRAMRMSPLDPLGYIFTGGLALAHLIARQYEEGLEWVERSLRELPRYSTALRVKVVLCSHLDRIEEARDGVRRLLELQPGSTVAWFKAYAGTFFPPELVAEYAEGLRKAGLPEE